MSELEKVTAVDTTYDASEIQVLEGLEAVRKRPGMYIGSTSASGLHHLVYEIVDNAIDEALAGYCTEITVTINPGDTITVTDNGRGIPVDIQKQTGRPALEVVYTVLHAGGKFGGGGYKVSGGLHGVGASVVNALSEWLEVQVQKDGRIYEMKFSRGGITQEMKILGDTDQTGTAVTFKPDPEMFDTLVYDYETLHTRMREQAFLNAGLRITITDARPGQEQSDSMCYEGGIREFVTWLNRNKTALHEEVIYLAGAKGDSTAEVALQYNDSYNETLVSFANDIHTPEGGMHETGFKTALTRVLNAYGMKYGIQAGRYDAGVAGISITADRLKNCDFSDPYFLANQVIVVNPGSDIQSKADLTGKTIAVQTGTTAETYCLDNGYEILSFASNIDAQAALTSGKADAWVVDNEVAVKMAGEQNLTVLDEAMTSEPYALAFAKGSDLVDQVNQALSQLLQDGTVEQIFQEYDTVYVSPLS